MEKTDKNLDNQTVNNYYINKSPKNERKYSPKKVMQKNDLDSFIENNGDISQFFAEGIEEDYIADPGDFFEPKTKPRYTFINNIVVSVIILLTLVTIFYNIFYISSYNNKIEKISIEISKKEIEINALNDELDTLTIQKLSNEYEENGYKKLTKYKNFTPLDKKTVESNTHKGNFFDVLCDVIYNFMNTK